MVNNPRQFELSAQHLAMLREGSGLSDAVISARGYRTVTARAELQALGLSNGQCNLPGLLLPVHTPDGGQPLSVFRPDHPRVVEDRGKRLPDGTFPCKIIKYEFPKGAAMRVDCPPACKRAMGDPGRPLWITEGQKKADALASRGLTAIALLGVWNFKGRNAFGGSTVLADFDYIAWRGRDVRIVYDSDVMTKAPVQAALKRLVEILQAKGSRVTAVYLPPGEHGEKRGVDDYLAGGHTVADLERLVEAPRPELQPAPARIELLDDEPDRMRQPIALIDGHGYVATWLPVRRTIAESKGRDDQIIRHDPPKVTHELELFVVRDDGQAFSQDGTGVEGKFGMATAGENCPSGTGRLALGFDVELEELPARSRTWTSRGVKAYRAGERPDPAELFEQVVANVDRFIDFDQSLADQRTMCELISCYIISTYFLPAFTSVGFLWAGGDRGSGKTQLLHVVCEMAYLGQVLLNGASFASLRDLADYGATLAFDDAENISDPKQMDPDKRAMLLAGNRPGATVPLKESDGDRHWRTRQVRCYCPRLFSAIRLPDPVLASRSIVVPLIRTPDRRRANADVLDFDLWHTPRQQVVDSLWAAALATLNEMTGYSFRVSDMASLSGRALEPWRGILAVALWLQEGSESGGTVPGLFERMNELSVAYQAERTTLEPADLKAVVLRVLRSLFVSGAVDGVLKVSASRVAEEALEVIRAEELDINETHVTPTRVGKLLAQMRLQRARESSTGSRHWNVPRGQLSRALAAHGLPGLDEAPAEEPPGE